MISPLKSCMFVCSHGLRVQLHNMNERKLVKGRSASFEDLAEEHKQQRKSKKLEKLWADAGLQDMGKSRHSVAGRGSPSRYVTGHAQWKCRGGATTMGCTPIYFYSTVK